LLSVVRHAFGRRLQIDAIQWSFSGMQPLIGGDRTNARTASREYRLSLDASDRGRFWLTVQGGKLMRNRRLAESTDLLSHPLGVTARSSTAERRLPCADLAGAAALRAVHRRAGDVPTDWIEAPWRRRGALTEQLIAENTSRTADPDR
jgi:glycerol-3-phosphate dehydrogenase